MRDAYIPFCTPSLPNVGPTCFSWIIFISVGREPDFKIIARLLADSLVKLPKICPLPPVMASLITGAVIRAPSKQWQI